MTPPPLHSSLKTAIFHEKVQDKNKPAIPIPSIMTHHLTEIVIPKEEAVFRLDGNGCWRNEGGKFRSKKIIDYFNAAIRRDEAGYYLTQERDGIREKVYFPHEDTALFVTEVTFEGDGGELVLNTGRRVTLHPRDLYVLNDKLYVTIDQETAKFTDRAMMRLGPRFAGAEDALTIQWNGNIHHILEKTKKETG